MFEPSKPCWCTRPPSFCNYLEHDLCPQYAAFPFTLRLYKCQDQTCIKPARKFAYEVLHGASFLWRIMRSALICTIIMDFAASQMQPVNSLVIRSVNFMNRVNCFVKDFETGMVYVRTGANITHFDENLNFLGTTLAQELTQNGTAHFTSRLTSPRYSCLTADLANNAAAIDNTTFNAIPMHEKVNCSDRMGNNILYKFPMGNYTVYIVRSENGDTELWYNMPNDCSTEFVIKLLCKVPRFAGGSLTFTEVTAALYVQRIIPSSSLYVTYVLQKNATSSDKTRLSVVCEYRPTGDNNFNQSWQQVGASKPFTSRGEKLYNMTVDGDEVLLVQQREQIKIIWLPLFNNTAPAQSLLDSDFGRNESSDSRDKKVSIITAMTPNGNRSEIYVGTESMIALLNVNKCAQYVNCSVCLMAADAPCGWCPATNRSTSALPRHGFEVKTYSSTAPYRLDQGSLLDQRLLLSPYSVLDKLHRTTCRTPSCSQVDEGLLCSVIQTCKLRNKTSTKELWLESITTSNERCVNPFQSLMQPTRNPQFLRKLSGTSATASGFIQNDPRITLNSKTTVLHTQKPLPHYKPGATKPKESMDHIILVTLIIVLIVLSSLIVVYLVKYLRVRKENRVIVQRFQGKYPECMGTKSCSRILDILRSRSVLIQYQYSKYQVQRHNSQDSEDEEVALPVTVVP
ncbi:uncharacterized protein LOC129586505 isoform X2 [Paramacrobiotus metropolitanus]|uniref:uncharacterized protein LOC129586505 isoform X2 n=1 Tax=Paramacrobiotus metropolitanus TaxID=2943436 RepID=UPI002446004B|nr:uncharacterized protein LOC129586505 isoform X2 [Paramacrobiotus metropolitanus]